MRTVQGNEWSRAEENGASWLRRFYIYQKERFPVLGHGVLVAAFSFSAISYSRICRCAEGFVSLTTYLVGIFITISLFLLVRIFDEFKDAADDATYRKELPVPRGLVSLAELKNIAIVIVILQVAVNAIFFPRMLIIYGIIIGYLLLMTKEFFIPQWLKAHQFWYVVSHMFIIPLVDIYASGLDWFLQHVEPSKGLLFFFAVSYMNGIVLEVGRKIRAPEKEATGVLTYTSMLGANRAVALWICVLFVTLLCSMAASAYAGYGTPGFAILAVVFVLCLSPAVLFLKHKSVKLSKGVEYASALWTIAMYLTLGGIPMISQFVTNR